MQNEYQILHSFAGRTRQLWKNQFPKEDYPIIEDMVERGLLRVISTKKVNTHNQPMLGMTELGWEYINPSKK